MDKATINISKRHPGVQDLMSFFAFDHLPQPVQFYSAPCGRLAEEMLMRLPDSAELIAGLRKLLEAKDCFVRAGLLALKQEVGPES